MPPLIDLTGQRFGRLVVIGRSVTVAKSRAVYWDCLCDCGHGNYPVSAGHLRRGTARSCGCLKSDVTRSRNHRHGDAARRKWSPEYTVWTNMKARCSNPRDKRFKDYGGRGIRIEFRSFEDFRAHVGERPPGTTIDRIDPDGNYAPGNVRWADWTTQARNRRVKPKVNEAEIARISALRAAGVTSTAIARQFNISRSLVRYYVGKL
jgi:Helix-turn-helix domain of resolvase